MPIEQYDLRALIHHYWRKGLTILEAVDDINDGEAVLTQEDSARYDYEEPPHMGQGTVYHRHGSIGVKEDEQVEALGNQKTMKITLIFLIFAYVAASGHRRARNCGLPTFTSRLPKDVQEKVLKIWENYEDGDDCEKEYQQTKKLIDALPKDVRSRAIRPKGPPFLRGTSSDELAEKLLNEEQRKEFNKFYAAMQRRKEEFQKKVEKLHQKLELYMRNSSNSERKNIRSSWRLARASEQN
ncbi:hypothetical protein KIN20_032717 [Parelaphostrongylus tenuis]|uniref:Uncharacterized protein n=1 Tax=Parelaphostrongylus tenuis TaxID=148309 RepID=A0AAD5WHP6_PARTN|nr:hypothetical protein KIN20_032717 [Parelaphostrongylus tenuis]